MHNLTVALAATYVVGSGQWVVHNSDVPRTPFDLNTVEFLGINFVEDVRGIRLVDKSFFQTFGNHVIGTP